MDNQPNNQPLAFLSLKSKVPPKVVKASEESTDTEVDNDSKIVSGVVAVHGLPPKKRLPNGQFATSTHDPLVAPDQPSTSGTASAEKEINNHPQSKKSDILTSSSWGRDMPALSSFRGSRSKILRSDCFVRQEMDIKKSIFSKIYPDKIKETPDHMLPFLLEDLRQGCLRQNMEVKWQRVVASSGVKLYQAGNLPKHHGKHGLLYFHYHSFHPPFFTADNHFTRFRVLMGAVVLNIQGVPQPIRAKKNDEIYLPASSTYTMSNKTYDTCMLSWVVTESSSDTTGDSESTSGSSGPNSVGPIDVTDDIIGDNPDGGTTAINIVDDIVVDTDNNGSGDKPLLSDATVVNLDPAIVNPEPEGNLDLGPAVRFPPPEETSTTLT